MALIRIEHDEFDLQISCRDYASLYEEASRNIPPAALWADYKCAGGITPLFLESDDAEPEVLGRRVFFFDNADYGVFIKVKNGASSPSPAFASAAMDSRMQRFGKDTITGTLNFGNDIGKFDLSFTYRKDKEDKKFCFTIEILSQKLDYHHDWDELVREIEAEHQTLALDFMREIHA